MRLDADIRELAETAQIRRREARRRVADQEIIGMRFIERDAVFTRAEQNLEQVYQKTGAAALTALADVLNYGLAVIAKGEKPE